MGTLSSGKLSSIPGRLHLLLDITKRYRYKKESQNWRKVDEECERTMDIRPLKAFWIRVVVWKTPASYKQGFICAEVLASESKNRASHQNSIEISAKLDEGAADVSKTHL